jgi:hypothetical protein
MTLKRLIGITMLTSPFIGFYIFVGIDRGFLDATLLYLSVFVVVGFILLGAYLAAE